MADVDYRHSIEGNKITVNQPGMYAPELNKELYIIPEEEISEARYNGVAAELGVYGPGYQVIEKEGKYFLKADDLETVKAYLETKYKEVTGEDLAA